MQLDKIPVGSTGRIVTVGGEGALRQHFLDMGVLPGEEVTLVKYAPMGDPMELRVHGYELTLRLADAAHITVELLEAPAAQEQAAPATVREKWEQHHNRPLRMEKPHPGLGEPGKYHDKETEDPVPKGTVLTFALAGNQNCGKTTLFNRLTGSNQHVGNFPGVTVDRKDGAMLGHPETLVTDLPGIYSLSPYTSEEMVSREFILKEKPCCLINIADATNLVRNLYLTVQLLELDIPVVLALNMMDELKGNGGSVDINEMEDMLGIPVIPISAAKNEGIEELVNHALHTAYYREKPRREDYCRAEDHNGAVHRALHGIMHLIEDHAEEAGLPVRFAAGKLIEGDPHVLGALMLSENEKEMLEHIIVQMEEERGLDRQAAMADMRFAFIHQVVERSLIQPKESREHIRSRKIDAVLTGKHTALPVFVLIMGLVFWLTFHVIGAFFQNLLAGGIDALTAAADAQLSAWQVNATLHSLIIDGIFKGVGSVLSFLPVIVVLFFFLSLLEDTGYMARIAFVTDKLLRKLGLSGRSIVPLLIGFGCTVPGVMASRTMPSERDRKMTVLLTPFMSCTAKLPVYGFITAAFFPAHAGLIMVGLYFLGILLGILSALLFRNTLFKGNPVPFVMELPNYRLPSAKNVLLLLWDKAKDFLHRAFTVIFVASIVIWFLQTFDTRLNMAAAQSDSILALLAGTLAPVFRPLGFGDWRVTVALLSGFMAKESVVSTLTVLFPAGTALSGLLSAPAAGALLVFCLLYTPCVAAIAAIRRELGGRWAFFVVVLQCVIAYLAALAAYGLLCLFL